MQFLSVPNFLGISHRLTRSTITCSKLIIATLEHGAKLFTVKNKDTIE